MTRSELTLICGFLAKISFRRYLHIVSKISLVMKKSMTYVQDELRIFSGLKLTNLGEAVLILARNMLYYCTLGTLRYNLPPGGHREMSSIMADH